MYSYYYYYFGYSSYDLSSLSAGLSLGATYCQVVNQSYTTTTTTLPQRTIPTDTPAWFASPPPS